MNNIQWKLRTCYTSQTSTVKKNLAEGFEPFWGYRCTRSEKPDVKMYFRKSPEPVVTELQMLESEPPVVQVDMSNVSEFIQQLNMILNKLPEKIAEEINKQSQTSIRVGSESLKGIVDELRNKTVPAEVEAKSNEDDSAGLTDEEVQADIQEMREDKEREIPAGDQIRVVDDVPDLPKKEITSYQQESLNRLRNTSEVNITIYPVDNDGNVRVFSGGKIYIIHRDGSIIEIENRAGRDSTAV